MKMNRFANLVVVASLTTVPTCYPTNAPPPGSHQLPITFQHWYHSGFCSAANISMWVRYHGTSLLSSQQNIVDYMRSWYPSQVGPDGSMSVWAIQRALWEWSYITTEDHFYVGAAEKRQAVADLKKGINNGRPIIVVTNYGLHSQLVKGGTWTQLPNYQPSLEYITTADPADSTFRTDTVGYWADVVGAGEPYGQYIRSIQFSGQAGWAMSELNEFDYWGGTYYGDEDPPDGCPECPPEARPAPSLLSWLQSLVTARPAIFASVAPALKGFDGRPRPALRPSNQSRRQVGPQRQEGHAVRKRVYVPKPYASSMRDVAVNLLEGMRQSHLDRVEGWEDLGPLLAANRIDVSSVNWIESLTHDRPYWLATLRVDDRPFARALVSDVGWLLSVKRFETADVELRGREWASQVAGAEMNPKVRLVHMTNAVTRGAGSSDYDPFFEVTVPGRTTRFVSQEGGVFEVAPDGPGIAVWKDGVRRLRRIR